MLPNVLIVLAALVKIADLVMPMAKVRLLEDPLFLWRGSAALSMMAAALSLGQIRSK